MTQDDDALINQWDLIRAFLALERQGDYGIAAELEGIDDSTLRRRIRTLEQHMGRSLFVRTEQGWKVASDQHALVQAALRMEEAARAFSRSRQPDSGIIRLTILDALAIRLAPVINQFRDKHPGIVLNITTETHFVDLEKEQVDIAIRLARPMQSMSSLRIRKLGSVPFNAYASKAYLDRVAASGLPGKQVRHKQLAMNLRFSQSDHNFRHSEINFSNFDVITWSDSYLVLAKLCEMGQGVVVMPELLAQQYPTLQPVSGARPDLQEDLWMISRVDLRAPWQRDLAEMIAAELAAATRS
jgi:DNA-binding transcriptional LysR family regulator